MVQNTLSNLIADPKLFDSSFPETGNVEIYPTLVVNERLMLNPFVNAIFQEYFIELLKAEFPKRVAAPANQWEDVVVDGRYVIKPVVILYIAELELLQIHIAGKEYDFWQILDRHINETRLFAPMTTTINKYIGNAYKEYLMKKVFPVVAKLATGCLILPAFLTKFWT